MSMLPTNQQWLFHIQFFAARNYITGIFPALNHIIYVFNTHCMLSIEPLLNFLPVIIYLIKFLFEKFKVAIKVGVNALIHFM